MKKLSVVFAAALAIFLFVSGTFALPVYGQSTGILDSLTIPKWVNQLSGPLPVYVPVNVTDDAGNVIRQDYNVRMTESYQQILPLVDSSGNPTGFGPTKIWGYGGLAKDTVTGQYLGFITGTPGPSFEAIRNLPIRVNWVNNLVDASGAPLSSMLAVDPTLHWANPRMMTMPTMPISAPMFPPGYAEAQSPVATVTHLHGAEVPSAYDGNPDAWFTADGIHGPAYNTVSLTDANAAIYEYPNAQEPTTLWYHDHALGITRINILSGLVGFYLLRDPADQVMPLLPSGKYDVPLCVQDRMFFTDGSLYYPSQGNHPEIHPYWQEAFLGDTIMVNGKVWPNMNVERGVYRFRLLDASNSRFYQFRFSNGMEFLQIGSDGGYLKTQAPLKSLLMGPAERADILVDFSKLDPGTKVVLENTALTSEAEKQTVAQIMQFTVTEEKGFPANPLPPDLNPTIVGSFPTLQDVKNQRTLSLVEEVGPNGTLAMYLDGQKWSATPSEIPELGTTEEWVIANPSISAHPIHLHLVQFQIISRQVFNDTAYMADWEALNGPPPLSKPTINLPSLTPYLIGDSIPPGVNEQGWKDTAAMFAGQVTTIRVRFTQQDSQAFPFDATAGPGYVWHCHLLEHEDNEMMRPLLLSLPTGSSGLSTETFAVFAGVLIVAVVAALVFLRLKRSRSIAPGK